MFVSDKDVKEEVECISEWVLIRAGCVLGMSALIESTGGRMMDGVFVFLVYLNVCVCVYIFSLNVYVHRRCYFV